MNEIINQAINNKNIEESENNLDKKVREIKEKALGNISPIILIKPAVFSFVVLLRISFYRSFISAIFR